MSVFVYTSHGQGHVVDEQTVRGRKSFLVEGSGFKVWVDEKDLRVAHQWGGGDHVNEDNSTTLPYDPSPQYPVDMFHSESTIQPGEQEIDADERLSPSNSLTLNHSEGRSYPGMHSDNFAKKSAHEEHCGQCGGTGGQHAHYCDIGGDVAYRNDHEGNDYLFDSFGRYRPERFTPEIQHFSSYRHAIIGEIADAVGGVAGMADGADEAAEGAEGAEEAGEGTPGDPNAPNQKLKKHLDPIKNLADDFAGPQVKKNVGGIWPGRPDGHTVTGSYRPAGLSDKYIRIADHSDHYSDPVQQFRDDPLAFIQKRAYTYEGSADIRLAEYVDLVESDPHIRTAAWKDVRSKALRLRKEGKVHVKDISPTRIYASVDGDTGTYECMILKSSMNNSIAEHWCSCPWGVTVGLRRMSFVGRMCSHQLASMYELDSRNMKDVAKKHPYQRTSGIVEDFKDWAKNENSGRVDEAALANFIYLCNSMEEGEQSLINKEDAQKLYDFLGDNESHGRIRNYDVGYELDPEKHYKEADVLHLRPRSLTPDMTFIEDGDDGQSWTDVEKDERKTTGPDNMVKKSRRLTAMEIRYASDEELGERIKDWNGAGSDLEKLRGLSAEEPHFQHKREQNSEIRDVIDELQDRGIDASQFVAALRHASEDDDSVDDPTKKTQTPAPASTQQPSMAGKPSQTGQPGGSSSITKPGTSTPAQKPSTPTSSGGDGALSAETQNPTAVGFGGTPGPTGPSAGSPSQGAPAKTPQQDAASALSGFGQAAGGIGNMLPNLINSIGPQVIRGIGELGSGIGSGISSVTNALSGLSGLLHHAENITNYHYAAGYPDVQISNQESFQGSGPDPKYWMGTSKDYVDESERPDFVDVTNLAGDTTNYGKKPQQGPKKASRRPFVGSENANPEGSTETSGFAHNDTTAMPFDQVYRSGAAASPWSGSRIQDFKRYVKQQGGQRPRHQILQEYLKKPHRNLDQGGTQHLQDYTSYAEQHEASLRYADTPDMTNLAVADVPGMAEAVPAQSPESHGVLASLDDGSDIVAQFHRMGGIEAINGSGGGGGTYSDNAIAEQAQGFLRTAGRHFSLSEQRELEEESHELGARNLKDLDLRGTHYEDSL